MLSLNRAAFRQFTSPAFSLVRKDNNRILALGFPFGRFTRGAQSVAEMTSATDVITYVGIPLAVLGIMPVLYTCIQVLITLQKIKRELRKNDSAANDTRTSLMAGIVELELPKYSLKPLSRINPQYWASSARSSNVRGGSWTCLNWDRLTVGHAIYRLQYSDELRQPQAEILLEDLVMFLLDLGAVVDHDGWKVLRTLGLRTPNGTVLFESPDESRSAVLRITTPDYSEGHLSLDLAWKEHWGVRDMHSLPPGWLRISGEEEKQELIQLGEEGAEDVDNDGSKDGILKEITDAQSGPVTEAENQTTSAKSSVISKEDAEKGHEESASALHSIRLKVGSRGLDELFMERSNGTYDFPSFFHLQPPSSSPGTPLGPTASWFASAATSLQSSSSSLQFWTYSIPPHHSSLAKLDMIPCGIMVVLNILRDEDVPTWSTPFNERANQDRFHQRFIEESRERAAENLLPPAQRDIARKQREEKNRWKFHDGMMQEQQERRAWQEKRTVEACMSVRLQNRRVAEAMVAWLNHVPAAIGRSSTKEEEDIAAKKAKDAATLHETLARCLRRMINSPPFAEDVSAMLEAWQGWADKGGMNGADLDFLRTRQEAFAYAAVMLACVAEQSEKKSGSDDLMVCLGLWRGVRVG
jgi:hypothetical protein